MSFRTVRWVVLIALWAPSCGCGGGGAELGPDGTPLASGLEVADAITIRAQRHLWREVASAGADATLRVVIEIPAGTTAKWQVDHATGNLVWELEGGAPRFVDYLGYPANYGIVPQTLLPREEGGDGDPLDVLVLGPAVPRGDVLEVRLLGVLRLRDSGESDDKLIAVPVGGTFGGVVSLEALDADFPGLLTILETWFANYKGPGRVETSGFGALEEAEASVRAARSAFEAESAHR